MSVEELFVKEYEELKTKVKELEKQNKLLEINNADMTNLLMLVKSFVIGELKPEITKNDNLYFNSVLLSDKPKEQALLVLARLGIKEIKKAEEQA